MTLEGTIESRDKDTIKATTEMCVRLLREAADMPEVTQLPAPDALRKFADVLEMSLVNQGYK